MTLELQWLIGLSEHNDTLVGEVETVSELYGNYVLNSKTKRPERKQIYLVQFAQTTVFRICIQSMSRLGVITDGERSSAQFFFVCDETHDFDSDNDSSIYTVILL